MTRVAKLTMLSVALLLQWQVSAAPVNTGPNELSRHPYDQILLQESKYTAGVLHRDVTLLDSVFAGSFLDTSSSGIVRDKRQMLAVFAAETPPSSIEERGRKIAVYGNAAVVTVEFIVKGVDGGKPYEFHGRATDVWVLQNGTWRCVAAHSSEIK